MPGLAHDSHEFNDESSSLPESFSLSANGIWSKNRNDVSYNQLQQFWSELSPQARRELLRIDKKTLFDHARKNMYCSRCNGLLLEGFSQIVMYGKSSQQEGAGVHFPCGRPGSETNQNKVGSSIFSGMQDEIQDPTVQPWGGLTTTREGSLTLLDCYLCSKSLKGLQIVFDGARARERERELLYPDACGCGGCGWISQGIVSYGRGHGTRETCALHTAKLSCDTLVDFWSALGEETRQSLLKMKEEDFVERLMYRFDRKRFCKGCRRNVIREFKELKELKRMRREPRCTSWFCVADTAFQYEVSDDSIQADWRQTFADTVGSYHHFEWAVGTREGKSDILEFDNVGTNGHVQVSGLDLGGLSACFITLRAWKLDGRCTEISVKAYALKGQQCVHGRLIVGDGYVTITKGESIRRFIEHAEEAEEDEDDDLMDKDGNEVGGECSRPQKHAKSPELAREFLLDAATVIFKEQVEKAFKEGTARQNAQSIFVCLALKLLEERVHVACKEIITLEKQMKLLEEEEKEKREEEERKERKRTKEREKKLRRKERLKGKEEDKEIKCSESIDIPESPEVSKKDLSTAADIEQHNSISCSNSDIATDGDYPNIQDEDFSSEYSTFRTQDHSYDDCDGQNTNNTSIFELEQSKFGRQRHSTKARHHNVVVSENGVMVGRYEPRHYGDNFGTSYRGINGSTRQSRINVPKSNGRIAGHICNEKFYSSKIRMNNRYDFRSCSCSLNNGMARVSQETKPASNSESAIDTSKQFSRSSKNNHADSMHESKGRSKSRVISGNYPIRDFPQSKKVWEPMESHKKYAHCNLDSDVTLRSTGQGFQFDPVKSSVDEAGGSGEIDDEDSNLKRNGMAEGCNCKNGIDAEAEESCSSTEIASKEPEICLPRVTALNNSFNLIQGSISSSDNCSPCLSECDINATSSNHETTESSTSDSEDASQQSEVRDSSTCIDNSLPGSHEAGIEKTHYANGDGLASRSLFGSSLDVAGSDALGKPMVEMAHNFDDGFYSTYVYPQPQSLHPPLPNKNTQFTVSKTPSATGYYHQNPVSRPFARTNALMHFPHEDQYFYPGPLGYSLNDDPRFCLQYGALHQPAPLFHTAAIPDCQSVSRAKGLNGELTQVSKPSSMREHLNGSIAERVVSPGANTQRTPLSVEVEQDDSAKLQDNNGGFSLFHFGGPVALSTGYISSTASSNHDNFGDFDPKRLTSQVEKDHGCSKKETTVIEEYNLFAASNTLRFSIF